MARTKGSKNRPKTNATIEAIEAEITNLEEQLKVKKTELKDAIAAKEAEDNKRILEAVAASGKSAEDIIALIQSIEDGGQDSEGRTE